MVIILLVTVVIFGAMFLIFRFFANRKFKKDISNNTKNNDTKNLKVIREESVVLNNNETEKLILKILEDNGDIKKIDKDIATSDGTSIYSLDGFTNVFWGDCDDGPVAGNNIILGNNHLIIGKYEDTMFDEDDYYIDLNNIKKITRRNDYCETDDEDGWGYHTATFVIYTKDDNSLELVYPDEVVIPDKNSPMLIKKANENIMFEYTFNMNIKNKDIKYAFDDTKLKIGNSEYFNSDKYEIVINYSDIISDDIVSKDSVLNIIIEVKNNYKYILVFSDDSEATKFYNELKAHLNVEV